VLDGVANEARQTNKTKPPRTHRAWTPLARALAATGDHWTLMIAVALAPGRLRLSNLHARLPGVSTGVLERYVQQMVELGLVTRTRFKEMPPRVELELTDTGRELLPIAGALARWGIRNLWSPPRGREQVDAGALLRLLPLLLGEESDLPAGSVAALVADAAPPLRCVYEIADGHLRAVESSPDQPTATVHADAAAWIAALGPDNDTTGLSIAGDAQLVARILDALARQRGPGLPQWAA
jgi:DNA-binding HxlR family transcriptional regulator